MSTPPASCARCNWTKSSLPIAGRGSSDGSKFRLTKCSNSLLRVELASTLKSRLQVEP